MAPLAAMWSADLEFEMKSHRKVGFLDLEEKQHYYAVVIESSKFRKSKNSMSKKEHFSSQVSRDKDSNTNRMLQVFPELKSLLSNETVDPQKVIEAITEILEKQENRKKGNKAFRIRRIWEKFRNRENQSIPLEELAEGFDGSYSDAQVAISHLNKLLEEAGFEIEIRREVSYRFYPKNNFK